MELILSLLLVPYVFWALLVVLVICYGVTVVDDDSDTILTPLIGIGVISYLAAHYYQVELTLSFILVTAAAYLAAGFVWVFIRWWVFVIRKARADNKTIAWFKSEYKITELFPYKLEENDPEYDRKAELNAAFVRHAHGAYASKRVEAPCDRSDIIQSLIPLVKNNKLRITRWLVMWPASLLFTFIDEPVRLLVEWAIKNFSNVFGSISKRVYKNLGE